MVPTLRGARSFGTCGATHDRLESQEPVFTDELDAGTLLDQRAHRREQFVDVVGLPVGVGDDEVRVLLGHDRGAEAHPLAAGLVDESSGVIILGVAKGAAGIRPTRLMFAPPAHDLADPLLGRLAVPGAKVQAHRRHQVVAVQRARAVPEIQQFLGPGARDAVVPDRHRDQRLVHVRSMTAGVHHGGSAKTAGHPDRPLEAGDAGLGEPARSDRQVQTGARVDDDDVALVARGQLLELPHQVHAEHVVLTVGDQEVRTVPEDEHRQTALDHQRAQLLEVLVRGERDERAHRPAHAVRGARTEGCVLRDTRSPDVDQRVERHQRSPLQLRRD